MTDFESEEQDVFIGEVDGEPNQVIQASKKSLNLQRGSKQKITFRFVASCGHFIHDLSEIGGRCKVEDCQLLICKDCSRVCSRCLKLLCPKHQKLQDGLVFCPTCKWIVKIFGKRTYHGRYGRDSGME